jgi:hypothetical protein
VQQDGPGPHEHDVSERIRRSTQRQEIHVQIRRYLATAAGAGALIASGAGLALAAPASAASPTASPSSTSTVSPTPAVSAVPRAPSPARTVAGTSSPGIEVPAGNAGTSSGSSGGVTSLDIAALFAAGVVLAGGGTVVAIRRRA